MRCADNNISYFLKSTPLLTIVPYHPSILPLSFIQPTHNKIFIIITVSFVVPMQNLAQLQNYTHAISSTNTTVFFGWARGAPSHASKFVLDYYLYIHTCTYIAGSSCSGVKFEKIREIHIHAVSIN